MTTAPFKLQVLRALTDSLKQVPGMADFDSGDGHPIARVYRGRAWFGDNDPIPMISILEGSNGADELAEFPTQATTSEYDWPLVIQGFVNDDPENPTDPAYPLLAAIRRRLAVEAKRKAGRQPDPLGFGTGRDKVVSLRFDAGIVRPADDVSSKAWLWLNVILRIVDHADEPDPVST